MNKLSAILLLSSLSATMLHGQSENTWPKEGATWEYCFFGDYPWFFVWNYTFAYNADTIINGHSYAEVALTHFNHQPVLANDPSHNSMKPTYYRQDGDTIYRYVNGQDYLYMINGLELDEEFTTFRPVSYNWNEWSCTPELPLKVNEVTEQQFGSNTYRVVEMKDMDLYLPDENWGTNLIYLHTFIEGIGLMGQFPYITYGHLSGSPNDVASLEECVAGISHEGVTTLAHYHDNEVSIDFIDCIIVSTRNADPENTGLKLFPNPASTTVTLNLPDQNLSAATLYDMQGREVLSLPLSPTEPAINVHHLPKGMYLIRATDARGAVYVKKLMME